MIEWVSKYIGWRNWAVLRFNSVFENIFVIFYIALLLNRNDSVFVAESLIFMVFSIFATTYGYLINDYSDIELDKKHRKPNTFENDAQTKALGVIAIILVLSVLSSLYFWSKPYFLILAGSWFLIATFYSLPPIRLKERGTVGILFVVMAQRLIPILILFSVFEFWNGWNAAILALYVLFRGFSSDLNHQLEDYRKDRQTGTKTFAVSKGYARVRKLFRLSLHVERILLAVILVQLYLNVLITNRILLVFLLITISVYFLSLALHYFKASYDKQERNSNPFDPSAKNLVQFLHHAYPSVALPLALNVILTIEYLPFIVLLLVQILIRQLYSVEIIRQSFVFQILVKLLKVRS
ncbi:MAG: UbiA family prenyltransferase [Calditrichaeota bacterium]|nr:UbiA family prenyltransferase [Calditrichota bacterium]